MRLIILFLYSSFTYAVNIGVIGSVFPVTELSLMKFIEFNQDMIQEEWKSKVSEHTNRPTPLSLQRTKRTQTHFYKPVIVLNNDLVNAKGEILWPKGTRVNAFKNMQTYAPHWIFFDADDKAQMLWAKEKLRFYKNAKVILTGGEIGKTEQELKCPIYFDQGGKITNQLKIKRVPAYVSRNKDSLKICEIAIAENGNEI